MKTTNEKMIDGLVDAMNAICDIACGNECSGIGEVWETECDRDLTKLGNYLYRTMKDEEAEGNFPFSSMLLFEAAHNVLLAAKMINAR